MSDDKYQVLILDDDYEMGMMLKEYLSNTGRCAVTYVHSESDMWECIQVDSYDILFLDYKLSETNGIDVLNSMSQAGYVIPTVMMTGEGSENIAARAIQSGALDYLVKGEYNLSALLPLIHKAVRLSEMQQAMQRYLEQIRYQSHLLDNMRDAVVVWDLSGAITYWNAAAEQLYEAPAAERLGQRVDAVHLPYFDPPRRLDDLHQAGSRQIEHRYARPSGEWIWISAHVTTLFDEGRPVGIMDVARDITPRRQEQEALVKSQNFIQRILDTSPNIIFLFNLNTRCYTYVNPEIKPILGYEVDDFTEISFDELSQRVLTDDLPDLAQHLHDLHAMHDGQVLEIEYRFLSLNQDWRWLKSREAVFSRSADGAPVEVIGVIQDVTASKQAEQALRKSEARYRAIVEDHQTEMICRFLPDTTLTFVNEAYCRYYGQGRGELVGTSFLAPVLPEDKALVSDQLDGLSADYPVVTFEQQVQLPDGDSRWQEWVSRAILDQNNVFIEFQAVGRDITERKRMEAQIKTAQTRLAQAARLAAIGELAAGVAHQISNPLTTIIADAQLLSHQLDPGHPSRESAEAIVQAGWRAQQVINELMRFSQPAQTTSEPVDLNETIKTALLLSSAHMHAIGVRLVVDLAEHLPRLRGNPRQLTDLWVNLLLLARSAFQDSGEHTIWITSRGLKNQTIQVEVADDGIPIPPEQYDKIFEPQLIPNGSARRTGIELSICREIVRQNRGQITITGSDTATIFLITFTAEGTF